MSRVITAIQNLSKRHNLIYIFDVLDLPGYDLNKVAFFIYAIALLRVLSAALNMSNSVRYTLKIV